MTKVVRPTVLVSIAEHRQCPPVDPSTVVLRFEDNRIDIGAYCYAVRDKKSGSQSGIRNVDLSTLCPLRVELIKLVIEFLFSQRYLVGKSLNTIFGYWAQYKVFLEWCDSRDAFPDLLSPSVRRKAVQEFCAELHIKHRLDPMATNKYSIMQKAAIGFTSVIFSDELVGLGIPRIYFNSNIQTPTEVPEHDAQAKSYSMCQAVYIGFSRFFKNFLPYPFSFELPSYLGGQIWVFPCLIKFMSPFNNERVELKKYARSYDFENGTIRSVCELEGIYKNRDTALVCSNGAKRSLFEANSDPYHFRRIDLANHAVTAFLNIFQANTGMNYKQLISLPWNESYTVEKADQGFRVVKWRAGGAVLTFRTTAAFIVVFKEFLKFRSKLLRGRMSSMLFFHLNDCRDICRLNSSSQVAFERFLRKIDSDFYLLRTRQWRSAKSDSVLERHSVAVASNALQNKPSTVRAHYSEGREIDQKRQFKSFFEALSKIVVLKNNEFDDIALAKCVSPGHPLKEGDSAISPDCKSEIGCLFCRSFRVNADEKGVRKLMSCQYFVQRISYTNPSDQFQNDVYGPVLNRIDEILNYLSKISPEMSNLISRVRSSVYDEYELESYWAGRIESLVQVGFL